MNVALRESPKLNPQPIDPENIINLPRSELLDLWHQVFCKPAPKTISKSLIGQILAFEVQACSQGRLRKADRSRIKNTAQRKVKPKQAKLNDGTRLIREWNGVNHVVDVQSNQYVWNDNTYRSLSAIAKAITGAHW